jgi:hypothetical protein
MKIPTTLKNKTGDLEVYQANLIELPPQSTNKMASTVVRTNRSMEKETQLLVLKSYVEAQNQCHQQKISLLRLICNNLL